MYAKCRKWILNIIEVPCFLDIGPKLQYNLLCDGLPEDKELREHLQIKKLVCGRFIMRGQNLIVKAFLANSASFYVYQ